tara:strand:- start:1352 stop:1558 length:207 start_codon:yes stop_codon:yes gene_type:complete
MSNQDDLLFAMGRLEGKVDAILSSIRKHDQELSQLEVRLRQLEQYKFLTLGAAGVVGGVVSALMQFIT